MRKVVVVLMSAAAVGLGTPPAAAQDPPEGGVVEEVTPPPAETTPDGGATTGTTTTGDTEGDVTDETEERSEVDAGVRPAWDVAGYGSAAEQSTAAKRDEAVADCSAARPPVSRMLAVGGASTGGGNRPWLVVAAVVAAGALLIAGGAFLLRRRREARAGGARSPRGPLETVATVLGIVSGLFGLAFALAPDLAPDRSSSESATMEVREVDARVRRGEYMDKTGADIALDRLDRSEVGNVVWLEIGLTGHEGDAPVVQVGLHDPGRGGALIDETAQEVRLRSPESQDETLFVPVWVGYPQTNRFEAHFRLVEDDEVRQIASTGAMRGSRYRYACDTFVARLAARR